MAELHFAHPIGGKKTGVSIDSDYCWVYGI